MPQQEAAKLSPKPEERPEIVSVTVVNVLEIGPYASQKTLRAGKYMNKSQVIAGSRPTDLELEFAPRGIFGHWVDREKVRHTFFVPEANIVAMELVD